MPRRCPPSARLANRSWLGSLGELREREEYEGKGVVAEIGVSLLGSECNTVPGLEGSLVGISEETLRTVPTGIGIGKEQAVVAVLRSGQCHVLITDARCAEVTIQS